MPDSDVCSPRTVKMQGKCRQSTAYTSRMVKGSKENHTESIGRGHVSFVDASLAMLVEGIMCT